MLYFAWAILFIICVVSVVFAKLLFIQKLDLYVSVDIKFFIVWAQESRWNKQIGM